ncbi:hypothetical protein HYT45_04100 [Candidatus Uhrbacteria bacterium]|nr:hypothetical protein [Candidatus Uhrbacteria bacterium]
MANENDDRDQNRGRGKNQTQGSGEMQRRLAALEAEILRLKSPVVKCAFCAGTGSQPDKDGKPLIDGDDHPIPCLVCSGRGKVRIP